MNHEISRRSLLSGATALGAALVGGSSLAAESEEHRHEHHATTHPGVLDAANDCSARGRQCLAHCLVSFQEGDATLADCARKVSEMLPVCDAFAIQVAGNSPYVAALGKVCKATCEDCEVECRKHEDSHVECKDCADACAAIVAAIDAM